MSLIIASYDNYLNYGRPDHEKMWQEIRELLFQDKKLYAELIEYWSVLDEGDNPEYLFTITPLMRNIHIPEKEE